MRRHMGCEVDDGQIFWHANVVNRLLRSPGVHMCTDYQLRVTSACIISLTTCEQTDEREKKLSAHPFNLLPE